MKHTFLQSLRLVTLAVFCMATARAADPLPSWNDGAAKQSILDFVAKVTKPGSPDFVPTAERIAVFDNDGRGNGECGFSSPFSLRAPAQIRMNPLF